MKSITKTFSVMNKVIIYQHQKTSPHVYDVSTFEKEEQAYELLFEDMDDCDAFRFEHVIENKEDKIERIENPELNWDDGSIGIGIGDNYIRKLSAEERKEELEEAKQDLLKARINQRLYQKAKEGNQAAAREIVETVKGRPYSDYQIVSVKNHD